jgi:hypothetical protein
MNAPVRLETTGAKSRDSTHIEAWLAWMAGSFVSLINVCFNHGPAWVGLVAFAD